MANVLLTQKCVRSCPYCFAKKHMSDSSPDDILNWENLMYITDLLETSNEKSISLLGGEPFLNTNIVDYVLYLKERNFHVTIFTSGIMSENIYREAEKYLSNIHNEYLSFICNVNNPKSSTFSEVENVKRFLYSFGHQTVLSYNIYKCDFELDFLIDYIFQYGLKKYLRLGLAHPIPGENNIYILPNDLPKMKEKLMKYVQIFENLKIEAGFDCGFPMCIFSDEELGKLYKINKGNIRFSCGPAIDIGPDMKVWSCFPLSNYSKKSLYDFTSIQEIYKYYTDLHFIIRNEIKGIYDKCNNCNYNELDICSGGCIAHSLKKLLSEAKIRRNEVYPDEQ